MNETGVEFNREQRRKLKQRLSKSGLSVDTAVELLERRIQALTTDALPVGAKVRLDYDAIVNQPGYAKRQQAYKEFVEANKDTEFTVEYDETHTSGKLVCLAEDTSEQKWLWHAADLIALEPVRESDADSTDAKGETDGNPQMQSSDVPEESISE